MFLPSAVASGDPLLWVLVLLLGTVAVALRKLIGTLSKMVRLELWAWFSTRHGNATKDVQKLIEQSSRQDLLPKKWGEPK